MALPEMKGPEAVSGLGGGAPDRLTKNDSAWPFGAKSAFQCTFRPHRLRFCIDLGLVLARALDGSQLPAKSRWQQYQPTKPNGQNLSNALSARLALQPWLRLSAILLSAETKQTTRS